MPEYIERESIVGNLTSCEMQEKLKSMSTSDLYYVFIGKLNRAPAADVAPVRHGRWIQKIDHYICSVCGDDCWAFSAPEYNYCPNCGAKMDGVDDE